MTREEERHEAAKKFAFSGKTETTEFYNVLNDFYYGALWADENPDAKRIYTKKQLIDMGFSFTTNGDIVTPDQLNEDLKKYLKYQKQKFIEKACEWLSKTLYIHTEEIEDKHWNEIKTFDWVTSDFDSVSDFIEGFRKAMEE